MMYTVHNKSLDTTRSSSLQHFCSTSLFERSLIINRKEKSERRMIILMEYLAAQTGLSLKDLENVSKSGLKLIAFLFLQLEKVVPEEEV